MWTPAFQPTSLELFISRPLTTQFFRPCRLVLWSGLDAGSVVLFDSGHGSQIPFEGVISEGPAVRIQFITDQPNHNTGFNIRYEGNTVKLSTPTGLLMDRDMSYIAR